MSKKEERVKEIPKAVNLPSLPKCDDHNREKWAAEYDRVETELLRRHLSTPSSNTTTLGLRMISGDFDRRIPAPDAPIGGAGGNTSKIEKKKSFCDFDSLPPRASTTEPQSISHLSPIRGSIGRKRPTSAQAHNNITTSLTSCPLTSPSESLRVLLTLLDPPTRFRTSFQIETQGIDISWIRKYKSGDRIPTLLTIETIREDLRENPDMKNAVAINSPRSALVLLRNGVTVDDLQMRSVRSFENEATSADLAEIAHKHYEQRRRQLLASLREEYRELIASLPLLDILDSVIAMKAGEFYEEEASFIQTRKQQQAKALNMNRSKMEKQLDYSRELQKKIVDGERKRDQVEQEMLHKRQQQREQVAQRQEDSLMRMQALREATQSLNMEFMKKLEARRQKMEEKEQALLHARQVQAEIRRKQMDEKSRRRDERIQKNKEHIQQLKEAQQEAYKEKEELAARRKAKLDAERLREKGSQEEKLTKAEELRALARQKAADHEAAVIAKAEERAAEAQKRLEARLAEREMRLEEEQQRAAQKEEQRRQAAALAERKQQEKKERVLTKREEHEMLMEQTEELIQRETRMARETERLQQDDKRFFVQRQTRALEFKKLMSVSRITKKMEKANSISIQRQKLLEATLRDRETMRLERERIQREMTGQLNMSI